MKKKIIISIIAIIIILFFCWNGKIEFVQSKVRTNLFLIKNHPSKDDFPIMFYRYNSDTKYFLDHEEDPGGFSSEELINYPDDDLATFTVSKCKNDTTKLVGRFRFYGNTSNLSQLDTIIYKCN